MNREKDRPTRKKGNRQSRPAKTPNGDRFRSYSEERTPTPYPTHYQRPCSRSQSYSSCSNREDSILPPINVNQFICGSKDTKTTKKSKMAKDLKLHAQPTSGQTLVLRSNARGQVMAFLDFHPPVEVKEKADEFEVLWDYPDDFEEEEEEEENEPLRSETTIPSDVPKESESKWKRDVTTALDRGRARKASPSQNTSTRRPVIKKGKFKVVDWKIKAEQAQQRRDLRLQKEAERRKELQERRTRNVERRNNEFYKKIQEYDERRKRKDREVAERRQQIRGQTKTGVEELISKGKRGNLLSKIHK